MLGDTRDHSEAANRAFAGAGAAERCRRICKNIRPSWCPRSASAGKPPAPDIRQLGGGVWRRPGHRRDLHGLELCALRGQRGGGRQGRVRPADVRERLAEQSRCGTPGDWPSGGPLPHVLDIWLAGAAQIDMLTPDIYQLNFAILVPNSIPSAATRYLSPRCAGARLARAMSSTRSGSTMRSAPRRLRSIRSSIPRKRRSAKATRCCNSSPRYSGAPGQRRDSRLSAR